jgi:hypothetical protein
LKIFCNVKHNFGNEIHDKQNNFENYEFKYDPNVLKSMSVRKYTKPEIEESLRC